VSASAPSRKGGPGITQSDLLVINKTDFAPLVSGDLSVMDRDAYALRNGGPVVFAQATHDAGVDDDYSVRPLSG